MQSYEFKNTPLPYAYDSLEPFIDAKTMELHHSRHLQTYIDNLNATLKNYPAYRNWSLEKLIYDSHKLPIKIRKSVERNAGGVYNHEFYFAGLLGGDIKEPPGELAKKINKTFGSYDKFKTFFSTNASSVFGSGYTWLVLDSMCNLRVINTPNQRTTIADNLCPILNIDVWEHAYYLKHYNKRADYITDWFSVINWDMAEKRYQNCKRFCRF